MSVLTHQGLADYKQKAAYHEAGHATAIYLNNRLKNLPPIFFQILFKGIGAYSEDRRLSNRNDSIAKVTGGRLIQSLPMALDDVNPPSHRYTDKKASRYTDDYRLAFEADIVNLLIGPLTEAKYCCLRDNEPFSQQLLTVQALKNYGGEADLAVVNDYLHSYSANKHQQYEILMQLFIQAFNFVNTNTTWTSITQLASYILASDKNIIGYDEVAVVLDRS